MCGGGRDGGKWYPWRKFIPLIVGHILERLWIANVVYMDNVALSKLGILFNNHRRANF